MEKTAQFKSEINHLNARTTQTDNHQFIMALRKSIKTHLDLHKKQHFHRYTFRY